MADVEPGAKARRKPRSERLPETPDAIDIAMHAVASGKPLPDVARRLLEEQSRLVCAQTSELRTRQVGERVRAALWAVLAIAAAAIVLLVGALLVRAARTDALVVQSFRVPPAMAARGLTGEVVATQLLDELARMQAQSESTRAASTYANNWENDLKIDIPNTGATAEQVWKLLRGWLGKETRISGEVIETPEGLALTARVGSQPGQRFTDKAGNLDALITQGADLIYSQTQPYRHAISMPSDPASQARQMAALRQLSRNESPMEQKWAYSGLSVALRAQGDFRGAIAMANKSLALDPAMIPAISNFANAHDLLGHQQIMVDQYSHALSIDAGDEYDPRIVVANRCRQRAAIGEAMRDPAMMSASADCYDAVGSSMSAQAPWTRAYAAILRGNPRPAMNYREKAAGGLTADEATFATLEMRMQAEMLRGPGPALQALLDAYRSARAKRDANPDFRSYYEAYGPIRDWPLEAQVLAKLGRLPEAAALIARTPTDCYDCVRTRGIVAEAMGDRPRAQQYYRDAAVLGPRLPAAFADWGRLLAGGGRYASAEHKLRYAVRLAPNWAEPLKTWGDMPTVQGKRAEATAKYDAALKLAPNWAELRAARGRVGAR